MIQVAGSLFEGYTGQTVVVGALPPDDVMEAICTILDTLHITYAKHPSMYKITCTGENEVVLNTSGMDKPTFCSGEPFEFDVTLALNGSDVIVFFRNDTHNSVKCNEVARHLRKTYGIANDR